MENKPAYLSKTVWVSLVMALAAFIPAVQKFIAEQPQMFAQIMGGIFLVLRFVTKGKIDIV